MKNATIVRDRFRDFLEALHLSREDAALLLDCSVATIGNYLQGKSKNISIYAVYNLSKINPCLIPFLCGDLLEITIDRIEVAKSLKDIKREREVAA